MTRRTFAGLFAATALPLTLVSQEKQEDRLDGRVQVLDKDKSTFTMTIKGGTVQRHVIYSGDTKFTFRNKAGSIDQLKEGVRVICLGKFDADGRLMATRIDIREEGR
jgi:hypothetical protein